jgi:hypothetical protein
MILENNNIYVDFEITILSSDLISEPVGISQSSIYRKTSLVGIEFFFLHATLSSHLL